LQIKKGISSAQKELNKQEMCRRIIVRKREKECNTCHRDKRRRTKKDQLAKARSFKKKKEGGKAKKGGIRPLWIGHESEKRGLQ